MVISLRKPRPAMLVRWRNGEDSEPGPEPRLWQQDHRSVMAATVAAGNLCYLTGTVCFGFNFGASEEIDEHAGMVWFGWGDEPRSHASPGPARLVPPGAGGAACRRRRLAPSAWYLLSSRTERVRSPAPSTGTGRVAHRRILRRGARPAEARPPVGLIPREGPDHPGAPAVTSYGQLQRASGIRNTRPR